MLKDLVKVASRLNSLGLSYEANFIDAVVRKFAHKEETYGGVDTSEEEAFENRRRSPYKGRDGGHKVGPRRKKLIYNPEELSDPTEEGEEFLGGMSYDDLSDDADDMFDSDEDFEQEIGDEDFDQYENPETTYFRRSEPVGPGRGRSVYDPSGADLDRELEEDEDPSNWTDERWAKYESTAGSKGDGTRGSDDANDMQRLAKRLSSIGLTKEARILYSIVKSANDDFYSDEETDEPSYYSEDEAIESIDNRKDLIDALERMSDRKFGFLRVTYPEAMEAILKRTEGERATPEQLHRRKLRENSNVNKYYSKKANLNYLDEEEFSDDAWDDGSTEPYHYRDPRADEEEAAKKAAMKEERERKYKEEEERINMSYYGDIRGNFAFDDHEIGRPPNRNFLPPWTKADRAYKPSGA